MGRDQTPESEDPRFCTRRRLHCAAWLDRASCRYRECYGFYRTSRYNPYCRIGKKRKRERSG
eukprot:5547965-Prymnesium_polylepis.1